MHTYVLGIVTEKAPGSPAPAAYVVAPLVIGAAYIVAACAHHVVSCLFRSLEPHFVDEAQHYRGDSPAVDREDPYDERAVGGLEQLPARVEQAVPLEAVKLVALLVIGVVAFV